MDRKGQLANVAFGGAWSEQIAGDEALAEAMACIEAAVERAARVDLRGDLAASEALRLLAADHPKGTMLVAAWDKALAVADPGLRVAELQRIAAALRAGIGRGLN